MPNRMFVSPMHQNHYGTQRQHHKEHCKNDYRHNLEPSAATAFRSAQHNRLSTLKLATYLAAKDCNRRSTELSHIPGIEQNPLLCTHLPRVKPGSSSMRGRSSISCICSCISAVSFASLISHHQRDHSAHYQQCNDHCNKSDGKHLILPLSSTRRTNQQKRSPARNALPPD
jgi:hypothetical protein